MYGNVSMIDCDLIQLDDGKWWCPACDADKKRLLPGNYRRNCCSPRRNVEIEVRREQLEKYLAVCRECPIDTWDDEGFCQKFSNNPCAFNRLLVSPYFECEHWKKNSAKEMD